MELKLLSFVYKIVEKGYRNYCRNYIAVKTNKGKRKLYENKKGCYFIYNGRRNYVSLPI